MSQTNDFRPGESGFEPLHFMENTNVAKDPCNSQWLLLWTYAAYTPEKMNPQEQMEAKVFFSLFQDQCRKGPARNLYADAVKENPPQVTDRRELCLWLSHIENIVRKKVNMPTKAFRYRDLMERWRYADGYL